MEIFLEAAKEFGPVGAVALWFAWRAHKTSQRISKLERWTRKVLMRQLRDNTRAMERNNTLIERLETVLEPGRVHAD